MKRALATALLAAGLLSLASTLAARPSPKSPDLASLPTEDLIARFQSVSKEGVGEYTILSRQGIINTSDRPTGKAPMGFGYAASLLSIPMVSPVMRELIRRGAGAVPALLEHLTDSRPTPLIVPDKTRSGAIQGFGDEYDPRDFDAKKLPAGLNRINGGGPHVFDEGDDLAKHFTRYRVKVGDLCWVALGQIVNRRLEAVHGRPTGIVQINSPVQTPALATAARADWSGLTPAGFKAFLLHDLDRNEINWANVEVLQRLYFYYPQDAIAEAVEALRRPLYNDHPVEEFVKKLPSASEEKTWDQQLADFRIRCGETSYQAVAQTIAMTAGMPPLDPEVAEGDPKDVQYRDNAIRLARSHFAGVGQHPTFAQLWLSPSYQSWVVESVADFQSAKIDATVRDLLKRTLELRPDDPEDKVAQCHLAASCAERLVPPRRGEAIASVDKRLDMKSLPACGAFLRQLAADQAWQSATPSR